MNKFDLGRIATEINKILARENVSTYDALDILFAVIFVPLKESIKEKKYPKELVINELTTCFNDHLKGLSHE